MARFFAQLSLKCRTRRLGTLAANAGAMSMRPLVFAPILALVTSFGLSAAAEETIGAHTTPGSAVSVFGNRGQLAISSEAGATFSHKSFSGSDASSTSLVLRPGVDYFLIKRLSLGVFLGVEHQGTQLGSSTTFGIGPRLGYDIAFSDRFSIWPRIGFSFNSTTVKEDAQNALQKPSTSTSNSAVALNLFAPFLFHTNHYFVGLGPALDTDLSGDHKATTVAINVTLGGWIF